MRSRLIKAASYVISEFLYPNIKYLKNEANLMELDRDHPVGLFVAQRN